MKAKSEEVYFYGNPVSEGVAIGKPFYLKTIEEDIPDFEISLGEVDAEVARYRKALFSSKEDLNRLREDLAMEGSEAAVDTIESHIQMLDDPMITTDIEGKIRQMLRNTESVFHSVINDYENRFVERTDSFFQERLIDVKDISKRILSHLRQKRDIQLSEIPAGSIVFAKELAPSYPAAAHPGIVSALVTEEGGGNSHSALIARSKGIPFISGIDTESIDEMRIENVIVDGTEGILIVNPSEETLTHYKLRKKQLTTRYQTFLNEDHLAAETVDGFETSLLVNVGNIEDFKGFPYKHDGVGLFRTEYLFLDSKEIYPSEDQQYAAYRKMIEKIDGQVTVIRVFDLGGDKNPSLFLSRSIEPNPVLGNRGIRFLLHNEGLFRVQLRAIFRASVGANAQILLPLISDINELYRAKKIINSVFKEVQAEFLGIEPLAIGCMIEVPSAVMICDALARESDFLSLGTNDLVQYTLGVDRSNPMMGSLFHPGHPSVLRMIKMISIEASRQEKPITICGEIASNTQFTPLLLGLGLSQFSVSPRYIPLIKQTIRKWTIVEAYELAEKALKLSNPQDISELLMRSVKN